MFVSPWNSVDERSKDNFLLDGMQSPTMWLLPISQWSLLFDRCYCWFSSEWHAEHLRFARNKQDGLWRPTNVATIAVRASQPLLESREAPTALSMQMLQNLQHSWAILQVWASLHGLQYAVTTIYRHAHSHAQWDIVNLRSSYFRKVQCRIASK